MIRNSTANRRKGATPRMSPKRTPRRAANGPRDAAAPAEAGAADRVPSVSELLDIGSDGGVPALGDRVLGGSQLIQRREHRLGVERWVRQLGAQVGRNGGH